MPWTAKDAAPHDKAAKTPKQKRQWADVANSVLQRTGNDARAVREANGVIHADGRVPDHARHSKGPRGR